MKDNKKDGRNQNKKKQTRKTEKNNKTKES